MKKTYKTTLTAIAASVAIAMTGALALTAPAEAVAAKAKAKAKASSITTDAVVKNYARIVHANYADTLTATKKMQKAIHAFTAKPSAKGMEAAKQAWLDAREFYGQTEAFRFYAGPIDDDEGPEGQINAWPMDESYVDYVQDDAKSGMINDKKVKITVDVLKEANERGGEENVSTGWHAIEFLLWGQDLSPVTPGQRPYTDFVDGKAKNADRRRAYLNTVTDLLVEDITFLVDSWKPGSKNYRATFEKGGKESLRKILVGLGSLSRGELAGERMEVALASQDKEDEHSCFSDNTHRDIIVNARGIQNVWLGSYQRADGSTLSGPSLLELVAASDPALASRVTQEIQASVIAAKAIRAPFDQEIIGKKDAPGRARVQRTVDKLTKQSHSLVAAAKAAGIDKLTLVEP